MLKRRREVTRVRQQAAAAARLAGARVARRPGARDCGRAGGGRGVTEPPPFPLPSQLLRLLPTTRPDMDSSADSAARPLLAR